MNTPRYTVLDTYPADLRNETPPRREEIAEIQDREAGDLLCYANPAHAARICQAVNGYAAALNVLREVLDDCTDHTGIGVGGGTLARVRAVLADNEGVTPDPIASLLWRLTCHVEGLAAYTLPATADLCNEIRRTLGKPEIKP
jgi:hypothetical protein